jgi:N utilization substance protein B
MIDLDTGSLVDSAESLPAGPKKKKSKVSAVRARSQARRCVLQALYQWQLTEQSFSEILAQFIERDEYKTADSAYFHQLLSGSIEHHHVLATRVAEFADRPWEQMDPIERAVLLIGMYELIHCLEVPYRVVVNEAVELTKQFGATDGYKYINALLDRAARDIRSGERQHSRN